MMDKLKEMKERWIQYKGIKQLALEPKDVELLISTVEEQQKEIERLRETLKNISKYGGHYGYNGDGQYHLEEMAKKALKKGG